MIGIRHNYLSHSDKIIKIMKEAVTLEVPNKVDYESGPNWGTIK